MSIANLEYVDRALSLVEQARKQQIALRILGSLAYRLHCPANLQLFEEMKRDLTDVDFAARGDQRKAIRAFLEGLGFRIDQDLLVSTEGTRYFFSDPASGMGVDVFFDELFFCHQIPLRDRLDLDEPTITLADLMLEKMQIVEINPKDIKDSLVLLLEHPLGSGERESIDGGYIAKLLANDWGFYYTVTAKNLGTPHHRDPTQVEASAGVVDHHGGTRVALEIAHLAGGTARGDRERPAFVEEPHRDQVDRSIAVEGGELRHQPGAEQLSDEGVAQKVAVFSATSWYHLTRGPIRARSFHRRVFGSSSIICPSSAARAPTTSH